MDLIYFLMFAIVLWRAHSQPRLTNSNVLNAFLAQHPKTLWSRK